MQATYVPRTGLPILRLRISHHPPIRPVVTKGLGRVWNFQDLRRAGGTHERWMCHIKLQSEKWACLWRQKVIKKNYCGQTLFDPMERIQIEPIMLSVLWSFWIEYLVKWNQWSSSLQSHINLTEKVVQVDLGTYCPPFKKTKKTNLMSIAFMWKFEDKTNCVFPPKGEAHFYSLLS